MSGKRIAIIVLVIVSLVLAACSGQVAPSGTENEGSPTPTPDNQSSPVTIPSDTPASKEPIQTPGENAQKTENLPDIDVLTTFPGVLESLSLTLEQLITVLGTQFELLENKAQGYDSYYFPQYNLIFDFDKISKKLSTVWLDNIPYYIFAGDYKTHDLNGDGKPEKIVTYEDQNFNGNIVVINGADSSKVSTATLDFFGDKCEIEAISNFGQNKESLIIIKTRGGIQGDILKFTDEKLSSILPKGYDSISEEALVTVEGDTALWVHEKRNILYMCTIPNRLVESLRNRPDSDKHRYSIRLRPMLSADSLNLEVRTGLQLKLADNYNFMDNYDGTYSDVAQVTVEYEYLGQGMWQETKTTGGPKYKNSSETQLLAQDLSAGGLALFDKLEIVEKALPGKLSRFTPDELASGILLEEKGLRVGITHDQITYLSLEKGSDKATFKGLKLSDTREKALSLYGMPDKGFMEDSAWTYYVIREERSENGTSFFIDTLNIEFDGDKVSRIWISAYVTAY